MSLFTRKRHNLKNQISTAINIPYTAIQQFCEQWQITEFALFGSVVSTSFHEESDIDVLVSFSDNASITLFDLVIMTDELEAIFHRKVDLLTRRSVEQSENHIRRRNILDSAQVIYAA